ncbi:tetratricopeptide repeat protein [bacterium]|nr:tetratricopeptide repeat protein [bacterium]
MNKFLTILNFILLTTLVILTLYVFDIIDIPLLDKPNTKIEELKQDHSNPPEKKEVVGRSKSYDELMSKAKVYSDNGLYDLAIDSYTQASQKAELNKEPLLRIAEIQLLQKEYQKAKDLSLHILTIDQHSGLAKLYLGQAYIGLEKFSDAKNILDNITSDDQKIQYYQGVMALYFGEYERGRSLLESASKKENKNEIIARNALNFVNALNEFDRYEAGLDSHLRVLIARSFAQTNQPHLAKEVIWPVLKKERDYRDAWIILGYSYLKLEQFKDAIDALEEATKQDPEKPETLFYLGFAYAGNDEPEKAIKELEQALENGYEPKIHVDQKLAELYFLVKNYDNATKKYEDVISLNSTEIDYFIRPIWLYIDKLNKPKKAVALAEKAQLNHPDNAMSYNLLGWAQVANNDYINGRRNLEKAILLSKKLDAPYLNMGWMYEKQNDLDNAKYFYKKAFDLGNGNASQISQLAASRYNAILEREKNNAFMVNIFN